MWDGQGLVREADSELNRLKQRPLYETGPVIFNATDHPGAYSGTGIFVIH